ncbi:unnamed protein product [Alopecurus aequalis]
MADGDGGGGVGGEDGGSTECLPVKDLVEAMLSNSRAMAEALAADRARLEAADRIQRESWEAARRLQRSVVEMQAEMDRLRAEAADAKEKLQVDRQADASRKMRWEAAYELLLGANQKLAELRDGDIEDSRTCAETPNSKLKEVASCRKLSQKTTDHIASDIRKLRRAYETLSSKKDKEVSALLLEKDSLRNELSIMQRKYAALLKNKKVEATQATAAALKLQRSLDKLKVLAQKKDDEIATLQADAVEAKRNLQKMHSLVKEKDDEIQRLEGRHPESVQKCNKDFSEAHKQSRSGDPAVIVREPENNGLWQTVEEDYITETKTTENNGQDETTLKRRRASSMSYDDGKSGCNEVDDEHIRNDEHRGKQTGSDEDGDEQSTSNDDGDQQSRSGDDDGQSRSGHHEDEQSGRDVETTNNPIQTSLGNPKRKRDACIETANGKSHSESITRAAMPTQSRPTSTTLRGDASSSTWPNLEDEVEEVENEGNVPDEVTLKQFQLSQPRNFKFKHTKHIRHYAPPKCNNKQKGIVDQCEDDSEDDSKDDEEPAPKKAVKRMSRNEEEPAPNLALRRMRKNEEVEVMDGDEQSGSDEDGDGDDDKDEKSGSDDETTHNQVTNYKWSIYERKGDARTWLRSWRAPAPLRTRKLKIINGRRYLHCTGHWGQYVKAVNDSLIDQPDKHKEFVRFLRNFETWRVRCVARTMEVLLDGQPKLIRQFNQFLPNNCQIEVEEEKQQPEEEQTRGCVVARPCGQLPSTSVSASASAAAAAGLIKLKEVEQQPKRNRIYVRKVRAHQTVMS